MKACRGLGKGGAPAASPSLLGEPAGSHSPASPARTLGPRSVAKPHAALPWAPLWDPWVGAAGGLGVASPNKRKLSEARSGGYPNHLPFTDWLRPAVNPEKSRLSDLSALRRPSFSSARPPIDQRWLSVRPCAARGGGRREARGGARRGAEGEGRALPWLWLRGAGGAAAAAAAATAAGTRAVRPGAIWSFISESTRAPCPAPAAAPALGTARPRPYPRLGHSGGAERKSRTGARDDSAEVAHTKAKVDFSSVVCLPPSVVAVNGLDGGGAGDNDDEPVLVALAAAPSPQSEAVANEFQELSLQPELTLSLHPGRNPNLPPLSERKNGE
ncbi:uncharacterized protein LOC103103617 [Monodelphis domestica]|uniref:uncharacterized protein LOC103103617 n=1 Tax=Monodelphis domestica TaxID=13616 RepID=UPI0007B41CF6|nr:uncharacterized protein LOC103103617 [Monodelphis domestica]